jgi:hypothetical protein
MPQLSGNEPILGLNRNNLWQLESTCVVRWNVGEFIQ